VFRLSARTGEGMDRWLAWLEERILRVRQAAPGERR
jgi:hypothetical protein